MFDTGRKIAGLQETEQRETALLHPAVSGPEQPFLPEQVAQQAGKRRSTESI